MKRSLMILLNSAALLSAVGVAAQQPAAPAQPAAPTQPAPPPAQPAPVAPPAAAPPAQPPSGAAPTDLPPPPPPRQADAGPPPVAEPPPPTIVVQTPPPPPPVRRTYHMHEGFYLRLATGPSLSGMSVSTDSAGSPDFSLGGVALDLDLLIGGSPAPGLALGGTLMVSGTTSAEIDVDGESTNLSTNTSHALLGIFVDGFPDPTGGLHLGGAVGLANARIEREEDEDQTFNTYEGGGLGMAAWVGYGGWVAPEWSLGGVLRFTGSVTRHEQDELTRQATSYGVALLFTALYH